MHEPIAQSDQIIARERDFCPSFVTAARRPDGADCFGGRRSASASVEGSTTTREGGREQRHRHASRNAGKARGHRGYERGGFWRARLSRRETLLARRGKAQLGPR